MPAYEVAEKYPDVYAVTGHYLNLMAPDAVAAGMAYTNDAEGQLNTVDVLNMESDNGDVDTHKPLYELYRFALLNDGLIPFFVMSLMTRFADTLIPMLSGSRWTRLYP